MNINISTNQLSGNIGLAFNSGNDENRKKREYKGKSLLSFPNDYIVIDIETTGLSPEYDSIIEICALKYSNKKLIDRFSSLVNPEYKICDFITELTGITNEMLSTAPRIQDIIVPFESFIHNNILVGHSVNFDINFIYDTFEKYLSKPLCNDFIDTLRLARRMHKNHKHNRLIDLASRYHLSYIGAHRAEFDCLLTNDIFNIFRSEFIELYGNAENADIILRPFHTLKVSDITTDKTIFDETHPLYGKTVVFTGTLEKMTRKIAMQIVVDYGGINGNSVTKDTNYLVLGNNDYCKSLKGGKSSKQKKAEQNILSGQDLQIIPENVFYDMVTLDSYELDKNKK